VEIVQGEVVVLKDGQRFVSKGLPAEKSQELVATYRDHGKGNEVHGNHLAVQAIAFAPDGKVLASGGTDGVIILREIPGGQEIRRIQAPGNAWKGGSDLNGKELQRTRV
jgi:WD40 repeat protein